MLKVLHDKLSKFGQEHLLKFWNELNQKEQDVLANQINEINWKEIDGLIKEYVLKKPVIRIPDDLTPAPFFPLEPKTKEQKELYIEAIEKAKSLLSASKVAAFTVAGGQGTRLGFNGPKGTYPITVLKSKSLFQYFAERIKRASEKYSATIPWYIMTSDMNHSETVSFFESHNYFELNKTNVMFFRQGTMPAIGLDGKILLDTKNSLALSPNGHGGSLLGLHKSGALADMTKRGVEFISYFQVDNPLVPIIDLLFIGLHAITESEMSAIMLSKTGPFEKLGNFCVSGDRTMIIEYSDMPNVLAEKRNSDGSLAFIAGSPAIHIVSKAFVERLTKNDSISLPWHRADKKVPFINENGIRIEPDKENAVKLESFIFDALPIAEKTMILEARREKQFAPTKNKTGVDSVESCREMLIERDAQWLEKYADIKVPRKTNGKVDCIVELSGAIYFDEEDVASNKAKLKAQKLTTGSSVYFE
ncbi:MAG: UDPGP type 1 family protein [Lentisphaerota bacterium]